MKKAGAEFLATYFLVFFGTGSIIVNEVAQGVIGNGGIAISFGLSVTILIYVFGNVSGAHMNPAVSLVRWMDRRLSGMEFTRYTIAQLSGALMASLTLSLVFPESEYLGATIPVAGVAASFALEFILTFFLLLTILLIGKRPDVLQGAVIGGVIFLEALIAGPVCGASMNPFRSIAPAAISAHWEHQWIYLVAPVSGGISALFCVRLFRFSESPE